MRKESIGRLLLTLLTAFIMVAGVFVAAVQTWSTTTQPGDKPNQLAESELDIETRETGDAPVSALDSDSNTMDGEITGQWSLSNGDVNQWEEAIKTWEGGIANARRKQAGNLCYNIAIGHEVLGNLDTAIDWAQRSWVEYREKRGMDYVRRLRARQSAEAEVQEQL